ncbi:MAG: hypothetical protein LBL33_00455 [Tannerella sp.]|jgi:hypothetical protein|nr:hypothetical protein [Tannerella sp.]
MGYVNVNAIQLGNSGGNSSDGRTYFCGYDSGIKVLDDATGSIVDTNITSGFYQAVSAGSDKETYFCGGLDNGIRVLNELTGDIIPTNIMAGSYYAAGTGSDGRTYFCGNNGIKILNIVYSGEKYLRKYGKWIGWETDYSPE